MPKQFKIRSRAFRPSSARAAAGLRIIASIASPSAFESFADTFAPESPTNSRTPPTSVATTGFAIAMASPTTSGMPSQAELRTNPSAASSSAGISRRTPKPARSIERAVRHRDRGISFLAPGRSPPGDPQLRLRKLAPHLPECLHQVGMVLGNAIAPYRQPDKLFPHAHLLSHGIAAIPVRHELASLDPIPHHCAFRTPHSLQPDVTFRDRLADRRHAIRKWIAQPVRQHARPPALIHVVNGGDERRPPIHQLERAPQYVSVKVMAVNQVRPKATEERNPAPQSADEARSTPAHVQVQYVEIGGESIKLLRSKHHQRHRMSTRRHALRKPHHQSLCAAHGQRVEHVHDAHRIRIPLQEFGMMIPRRLTLRLCRRTTGSPKYRLQTAPARESKSTAQRTNTYRGPRHRSPRTSKICERSSCGRRARSGTPSSC